MSNMDDLIARLEAATEGSRELDWYAVGCPYWEDCADGIRRPNYNNPPYTTSLDAALTLVPEGFLVTIDKYLASDERPEIWRAWVKWLPNDEAAELQKAFSGLRSTPAHAVCIAALKARAAK